MKDLNLRGPNCRNSIFKAVGMQSAQACVTIKAEALDYIANWLTEEVYRLDQKSTESVQADLTIAPDMIMQAISAYEGGAR